MADRFLTAQDVQKELNIIERLGQGLNADDKFLRAMLENQKLFAMFMLDNMSETEPVVGDEIDLYNLPNRMVGISLDEAPSGDVSDALFSIEGSDFLVRVRPQSDIEGMDAIQIIGENNQVVPIEKLEAGDIRVGIGPGNGDVLEPDEAFFEVGIDSVDDVIVDDIVEVIYTVENIGDASDIQNITLTVDSVVDDETVSLNPDESVTSILKWDTEGEDVGDYSIVVESDDSSSQEIVSVLSEADDFQLGEDDVQMDTVDFQVGIDETSFEDADEDEAVFEVTVDDMEFTG